jgi:HTH-type transcriptional regulator / antitoxin HipB
MVEIFTFPCKYYRSVIYGRLIMTLKADNAPIRCSADLGRQIRAARKAQGLTQAELAETAGVGARFVSELERGKDTARLGLALELARLVGIDLLAAPRRGEKL